MEKGGLGYDGYPPGNEFGVSNPQRTVDCTGFLIVNRTENAAAKSSSRPTGRASNPQVERRFVRRVEGARTAHGACLLLPHLRGQAEAASYRMAQPDAHHLYASNSRST